MLKKNIFAELLPRQTFPLYSILYTGYNCCTLLSIYVLFMLINLWDIIHATDYLKPTPTFTADTIDHKGLLNKAQELFQDEFVMSSRNTYAAGQGIHTNFCKLAKDPVILRNENMLILLVTCLTVANDSKATIKVYLLAVWKCMFQKTFMVTLLSSSPHSFSSSWKASRNIKHLPTHPEAVYSLPSISCSLFEDFSSWNLLCHTINMLWAACCPAFLDSSVSVSLQLQIKDHMIHPTTFPSGHFNW